MIDRYTRPQMKAIWDLKHKYEIWLEVELQACAAFEKAGQAPRGTSAKIRNKVRIDVSRIAEIEKVTKHDVIAFLTWVSEQVGEEARFMHQGMTSSDVLDTTLSVQLARASDILLDDLDQLLAALKKRALEHKMTPTIGRSHGIHAEPTTFGLKVAGWLTGILDAFPALKKRQLRRVLIVPPGCRASPGR